MEALEVVWKLFRFRADDEAGDEELKQVIEQQLEEAKDSIERLRDAGVPIPPIPWDVADRDVVMNFQHNLEEIRRHLSEPQSKRPRRAH
jgi:hypothetical protein